MKALCVILARLHEPTEYLAELKSVPSALWMCASIVALPFPSGVTAMATWHFSFTGNASVAMSLLPSPSQPPEAAALMGRTIGLPLLPW